jgi:capsular exopolysaccharide synthesis family protein
MLAKHELGNVGSGGSLAADLFRPGDPHPDAAPGERILPILWRRKLLLLLCTAVAVGTTLLYLRRVTPLYSSTARISIEQSVVPFMGNSFAAPLSPNFIATQAEVIKSTNVLELAESKLRGLQSPDGGTLELKTFAGDTRFIDAIQADLTVTLDPKVDIIDVSFVGPYPDEAADVVNEVVAAYKDRHQSETHRNSVQNFSAAQAEKKKRDEELADAIRKLNALRREHPNVGTGGGNAAIAAEMTALTSAVTAAQIQVAEAEATYAPNHPSIQAARRHEEKLEELLAKARKNTAETDSVGEELLQSQQDVAQLREQAVEADKVVKEAAAACSNDDSAARINVLEQAHPELSPVRPRKTQLLSLSVVLGLMLGGAAALGLEWADQRISGPEDTVAILRVPILGIVPVMKGRDEGGLRGLHVHLDPMSLISEAYRTIRTAICFGVHGDAGHTVLVTSPAPGDGKSTTAANLAIAMTQSGERVLLIDADMRKPTQHSIFNMPNDVGLSSVLAGECPAQEAIQQSSIKALDLLTSGPTPRNPAEILTRKAFVLFLQEIAGQYDRVILDSPPVKSVSDTLTLAAFCNVTVLTLRAGKSTRGLTAATRDSLLSVGANIVGIVINGSESVRSGYSVYGRYERPAPGTTVRVSPRSPEAPKGLKGSKNGNSHGANGNGDLAALIAKPAAKPIEPAADVDIEACPSLSGMFQSGFPIRPGVRTNDPPKTGGKSSSKE